MRERYYPIMRRSICASAIVLAALLAACSGTKSGTDLFEADASTSDGSPYPSFDAGHDGAPAADRSAIVLDVRTDMKIPGDLDAIHLEVTQAGAKQLSTDYPLGNPGQLLPASLTLCATDALCNGVEVGSLEPGKITVLDPTSSFEVTLIGQRRGQAITIRVVRTTLVPKRVVRLSISAEDACRGQLRVGPNGVSSSCSADQSCVGGACASNDVDASTLPDVN
jgi:hypothetical protein